MHDSKVSAVSFASAALAAALLSSGALAGGPIPEINEMDEFTDPFGGVMDYFGSSVAASGDVMVIGSREDDDGGTNAGAVWVYRFVEGTWVEEQKLLPSNPDDFAEFGHSVDVDGDVLLVGAYRENEPVKTGVILDTGAVYIFRYDGDGWFEEQRIVAEDQLIFNEFGSGVAIQGDRALISAHHVPDACKGALPIVVQNCHSGAAYIFDFDGEAWTQTQKLVAHDTELRDVFGRFVALDGDLAVVGAWNEGNTAGPCPPICNFDGHGAAYVFRLVAGTWIEEAKLLPDDATLGNGDNFADAVGVYGDRILVGSKGDDDVTTNAGAGYVFRHAPIDGPSWPLEQKLLAPDGQFNDFLGDGVAIDGNVIVLGAGSDDFPGSAGQGSAYVYLLEKGNWALEAKLVASDGVASDYSGQNVAAGGGRALVSAIGHDERAIEAGAAYVYGGISDCNGNDVLDALDIATGASLDEDGDLVPDECAGTDCPADLDASGTVDFKDLLQVLTSWGPCPQGGAGCPEDLDASGTVEFADLLTVLTTWGPCR